MFKTPQDKANNDKKPNQAHLGNHLTGFATDLLLGGTKQDIDSSFNPKSWTNKPKDKHGNKNRNGK
ncbi:MAG TPA: hypothetical protein VFM68_03550 [Candidatus Saccharimonadales bacterium]|nr:hypothetical protein [Candidatus Saccharimonadales bacterium]